jgi:hypothetical protein
MSHLKKTCTFNFFSRNYDQIVYILLGICVTSLEVKVSVLCYNFHRVLAVTRSIIRLKKEEKRYFLKENGQWQNHTFVRRDVGPK